MRTTLRDFVPLITAAASGLGRAVLALTAARRGARVVLADRQRTQAEQGARPIHAQGGRVRAAEPDVRALFARGRKLAGTP